MPRTETNATAQLIISPGDLDPNTVAGAFAATTHIEATYVATWNVHPPEPANGILVWDTVLHAVELRSIEVTIELQGEQHTHPCAIKDLPQSVIDQITEDCHTHALEMQHSR